MERSECFVLRLTRIATQPTTSTRRIRAILTWIYTSATAFRQLISTTRFFCLNYQRNANDASSPSAGQGRARQGKARQRDSEPRGIAREYLTHANRLIRPYRALEQAIPEETTATESSA